VRWTFLLLIATSADARTVKTGGDDTVRWHSKVRPTLLLEVTQYDEASGDIALQTNGSPPEMGARFNVLDEQGWLGTIEVTDLSEDKNDQAGTDLWTVSARLVQGSGRTMGDRQIAVGPIFNVSHRGRLLPVSTAHLKLPPSVASAQWAVDLDGDGQPELVQQAPVACERKTPSGELNCAGTWTKSDEEDRDGGWKQTDQAVSLIEND
jgi:hypothetical protein